jgi:hypothetical protein
MPRLLLFLLLIPTAVCARTPEQAEFYGKMWWDFVKVLASDKMEGPETGSEGLRKAAAGKFEDIVRDLTTNVANTDHRSEWKPDSFFRRFIPKSLSHPQP